jgi:ubiquinone/menaquinone biosynthesis C-methylase UbiE
MPLPALNDRQYLKKQYKDSTNLAARIQLHQRFSVSPYGWHPWVFDHFELPSCAQILELGCGPGYLWLDNRDRIPSGWEVILSDFSAGMLERTRLNLKGQPQIQFKIIDAQSIPFGVATFDAVIANHMLYHIPELPAALAEICRILKPAGIFYASTVGDQHLVEIGELIRKFDPALNSWGGAADAFTLDNGMAQLSEWFTQVTLYRYEDALEVTDAKLLMDYIISGREYVPVEKQAAFRKFLVREMEAGEGVIHITKDSGLFVCKENTR